MSYNKTLYINDKIITIVNIPLKLRQLAKLTVECFPLSFRKLCPALKSRITLRNLRLIHSMDRL